MLEQLHPHLISHPLLRKSQVVTVMLRLSRDEANICCHTVREPLPPILGCDLDLTYLIAPTPPEDSPPTPHDSALDVDDADHGNNVAAAANQNTIVISDGSGSDQAVAAPNGPRNMPATTAQPQICVPQNPVAITPRGSHDTYREGEPCPRTSCCGRLVARTSAPTAYRPRVENILGCSEFPHSGCPVLITPERVRVEPGKSRRVDPNPAPNSARRAISFNAPQQGASPTLTSPIGKASHGDAQAAPHANGNFVARGNFRKGECTVLKDGSKHRRYRCKKEGCGGTFYLEVKNGDEIGHERWTTPCNHAPLPQPVDDPDKPHRPMVRQLLERGLSASQVELQMMENGTPVKRSTIANIQQQMRREGHDLTHRLNEMPNVDTIMLKFGGSDVLSVVIMDPSVFPHGISWDSFHHIFIDGTHGVGPRGGQLVTVLGWFARIQRAIPIAFMITQGATCNHYLVLLIRLLLAGLRPSHVHVDFELAEINAISAVWPNAHIVGCFFHLKQAWFKKWRDKYGRGHKQEWKEVSATLDRLAGSTTSEEFIQIASNLRDKLKRAGRGKFWDYIDRTWIKRYPPEWWTLIGNSDEISRHIRTNNPSEGFHNYLKLLGYASRRIVELATHLILVLTTLWGRAKMEDIPPLQDNDDDNEDGNSPGTPNGLLQFQNRVNATMSTLVTSVQQNFAPATKEKNVPMGARATSLSASQVRYIIDTTPAIPLTF